MKISGIRSLLVLLVILMSTQVVHAQEPETAVVQAILFYSPTCPHCHEVMENHLPAIKEQYGDRLQLVGIDTSLQVGSQLYQDAVRALSIPEERLGVPTIIIGEVVLVGSSEIPEQLPMLIEAALAEGGIGWPDIPGLSDKVPNLPPKLGTAAERLPSGSAVDPGAELLTEPISGDPKALPQDRAGFTLGWAVMAIMLLAIIFAIVRLIKASAPQFSDPLAAERLRSWWIPLLALLGLGIALYLAYVEITQMTAVCGPVGECNIVQSSPYARILNIPVAVLGALYYLGVLGIWFLLRLFRAKTLKWTPMLLLILSLVGVIFSIYLTALELFVIHAICAWCISSAVISTLLMVITVVAFTKPEGADRTPGMLSQAA